MPASRAVWSTLTVLLFLGLLIGLGLWRQREHLWSGPLYCIEKPGTFWNGLAALPPGLTPECPQSQSYRQEVRSGQSRVEVYRLKGWRPQALLSVLTSSGYRQETDDPIAPGNYAAFLEREGQRVQYLAVRQGDETLITVSGRP